MRHPLSAAGSITPQPPGRTPHKAPQARLRCPGGEDQPPEASEVPAREADQLSIVLISASDTDLLAARASGGPWRLANPARTSAEAIPGLVAGAFCVIVRLLGGRRSWPGGPAAVLAASLPTVALSGAAGVDAHLTAASTGP